MFEGVASQRLKYLESAWTMGTLAMIHASLVNQVFPHIGTMPVDDIEPKTIRAVVKEIEVSGATETAGRVVKRIRAVFRYAAAHDGLEM